MPKRIIITAGGTGGHLFPAQALAWNLRERFSDLEILFMAAGLSSHPRFDREQFRYKDVASAALSKNPIKLAVNCAKLLYGTCKSLIHVKKFAPDLIVGFGSNHSFPALLAAKFLSVPIILHESNSIPGKVNRFFAKNAEWTGVFFPNTAHHLSGSNKLVTIPMRSELKTGSKIAKSESLAYYGLKNNKKTLLIFGGSQGAKKINELVLEAAELFQKNLQIIHFTGSSVISAQAEKRYTSLGIPFQVKDFETNMHYAWAAADGFIGRSGAGTISEQIAFQVPGIFIPYPFAADNHQEENARFIADVVQGAYLCIQKELAAESLAQAVTKLFDAENLKKMKNNLNLHATSLIRYDFVEQVANYLKEQNI
jgi:UDP-N-acetylglucosamine--N-acetylmuramyl-(pentapeptide) pyrophosphoryl-undecaprenol N-acetylglucosamine transferase